MDFEKINDFITDYTVRNDNHGYLRLTVRDEVVLERSIGYADREKQTAFDKNSLFTLYSLSKPFCALGLMKLVDRGLVKLDAHPGRYVPEAVGFHRDVTVEQLLHHTGGVPDFVQTAKFHQKYSEGKAHQMRQQLLELVKYPMVSLPGTAGMYANINYILAALIIENVSGQDYGDYMAKEVFAPLGMESARVDEPGLELAARVTGYEIYDGKVTAVERTLDWMLGAGDIIASADDVYCLNKAIKHKMLISEESWKAVLTPSPLNAMGLGCRVNTWHGKKRITHNGGSEGFRTLHIQLPEEDLDIIYLSNSGWGNARADYAEAVYGAWFGSGGGEGITEEMDKGYI